MEDLDYFLFVTKSVKATSSEDSESTNSASGSRSSKKKRKLSGKKKAKKSSASQAAEDNLQFINPEDEIFFKASFILEFIII